ncbi:MAG: (2Fe-2S)-binding protein, partial [Thermoprotei archaeon]
MGSDWRREVIVCRCNDVTLKDIEDLIDEGITDIEEIKRLTSIGMGPCQGRTCIPIVIALLARKTGKTPDEVGYPSVRPPIRP